MDKTDNNEYVQFSRIRSKRRRKRMQILDFDKRLIRLDKEETAICAQIRNLGWTELKPPFQRGFIRFFILRDDVRRTKEAPFFEKLLEKINTLQWSYRRDFKRKRKRFGKKVYAIREQKGNSSGRNLLNRKDHISTKRWCIQNKVKSR
jgi:hypothetical protein